MYSPTTLSTIILSLITLTPTSARIIGIQAPTTIIAGQSFPASILTENYIQSVTDVSVAWGIQPGAGFDTQLGQFIAAELLVSKSNSLNPIPFTLDAPANLASGPVTLRAAVTSLYGASRGPTLQIFNVSVTVGTEASTETIDSLGWYGSTGFQWIG